MISVGGKLREKVQKPKPVYEDRVCKDCGLVFKPTGRVMRKCKPCRDKWGNRTYREKWLAKKPHKNSRDSNQVAYAFFRKKYGVSNNVYRG